MLQSRAVRSSLPVAIFVPSAEKATRADRPPVRHRLALRSTGPRVPSPHQSFAGAGRHGLLVRAERHGQHRVITVADERRAEGMAAGRLPELRRAVVASGKDQRAVVAEFDLRTRRLL